MQFRQLHNAKRKKARGQKSYRGLFQSPLFQKMKDEGKGSKAPLSEAFGNWSNAKIAILALFGLTAGHAVIWYGGQFYARVFLVNTLKVPANTADVALIIALCIATVGFCCSAGCPIASAASRSSWQAACSAR
jgi:hypothetical protein